MTITRAAMLRGPDPEKFRTSHYGARWYVDPLPADDTWPATKDKWPSVTTIKKAWSKPFRKRLPTGETVPLDALWAAEFVADNLDAVAGLSADRYALLELICGAGRRNLTRAGDRGTGVHEVMEALADGNAAEDIFASPDVAPYVAACAAFVADWSPEWIATEFVVINRTLGYGGTADTGMGIVPTGVGRQLVIGDWKSRGADSKHGCYEEEVAQIGGYSLAEYMIVLDDDGNPVRRPPLKFDGGLIVSLRPDGYEAYPVDLGSAQEAFRQMLTSWHGSRDGQKAARAGRGHPLFAPAKSNGTEQATAHGGEMALERAMGGAPADDVAIASPSIAEPVERPAPPAIDLTSEVDPIADPARVAWVHARLTAIKDAGYMADLALRWDAELVPPPVTADSALTDRQVSVIAYEWCDHVEGLHGMPFGPSDPLLAAFDEKPEPVGPDPEQLAAEAEAAEQAKAEARALGDQARALLGGLAHERTNAVLKACGMTGFETMNADLLHRLEVVMAALADGVVEFSADDTVAPIDAETSMVAVAGSKGEARDRAARLAKRMGRIAPRSLAKAAENPLLVALVVAGEGAETNNTESDS